MTQSMNERALGKEELRRELENSDRFILDIIDQNDRAERMSAIGSEAIRHVVERGIGDEQIESFNQLLASGSRIPYAQIGQEYVRLENKLEDAKQKADAEQQELQADLELAHQLTTRRSGEIDSTYQLERDKHREMATRALQSQFDEFSAMYDETGRAWPIPTLIPPSDRKVLFDLVEEESHESFQIVDIIPVTPEERNCTANLADRIRRTVENPQLSDMVLLYLQERQSHTVTVEDLVRFCYALDLDDTNNYRSRITTTLGPKVGGQRKQEELNADGLVLQYGWRYAYEVRSTGERVMRRRTRIYRVVETADEVSHEEEKGIVNDLTVVDEWAPLDIITSQVQSDEVENTSVEDETMSETHEIEWQEKLIADVESALDTMQEAYLFGQDQTTFRGTFIRTMTESTRIGTETSRQRLAEAGIISKRQAKQDSMTSREIAISYVFNSHPELGGRRGRQIQRKALAIVDSVIEKRQSLLEQK